MDPEEQPEPGCRITLKADNFGRPLVPPALRNIITKERNRILGGLTAEHINPLEALESLRAIHDPHINNVMVFHICHSALHRKGV